LFTGAKVENPYNISVPAGGGTGTLSPAQSTTDGYIEAMISARYVTRYTNSLLNNDFEGKGWISPLPFKVGTISGNMPDLQLQFGYVFRGSSAPTNFTVSTIAGGSDIYGEASMGFPCYRYASQDKLTLGQATIELSGGFVTDKNFLTIHPDLFIGGGYQLKDTWSSGPFYWFARIGAGRVDHPVLTSGSSVALNGLNEPIFTPKWAASLGTLIIIPTGMNGVSAQVGGNVYLSQPPASWNLTVGVSIDPMAWFGGKKGS
jgi:hypothetical protein